MSVTTPQGFRASGVVAGLKSTGAPDVALVVNDGPRHDSASVFTANRCKANPVLWSQEVVKDGRPTDQPGEVISREAWFEIGEEVLERINERFGKRPS